MVQEVEKDPFAMTAFDLRMVPKATREIMFGLLTENTGDALTPMDIAEQVGNLRKLALAIELTVNQWDRKAEPFHRILSRIEKLVQENNGLTLVIRRRAKLAAKDRRLERVRAKITSIKFGTERVPVENETESTGSQPEKSYNQYAGRPHWVK